MSRLELRPVTSPRTDEEALDVKWAPVSDGGGDLKTSISPCLEELGDVPAAAIDLVRIATAAYLADASTERTRTFTRSLDILVHVRSEDPWSDELLEKLANLLSSLSGDRWSIAVVPDESEVDCDEAAETKEVARVALFSGGLDSFAGAVLSFQEGEVLFLGHVDNGIVKGVQDRATSWLADKGRAVDFLQIRHGSKARKVERTYRTRAALFMALASAVAVARAAKVVEVPENGYTSLNPPLGPERGGALSTRSTHPYTIHGFNEILDALGLDVTVSNPHQDKTKGELVQAAAAQLTPFAEGAALTLSCGKFDGNYYIGGDVNKHCGLCVPCVVRRASLLATGVADETPYLSETLDPPARDKLLDRRADDVFALKMALAEGLEIEDLIDLTPYPPGFDLERALDLCRRALAEISLVELP
jgi:hypothetical protein